MHISIEDSILYYIPTTCSMVDRVKAITLLLRAMEAVPDQLTPREEEMLDRLCKWLDNMKDSESWGPKKFNRAFFYTNTNNDNSIVFMAWSGYDEFHADPLPEVRFRSTKLHERIEGFLRRKG